MFILKKKLHYCSSLKLRNLPWFIPFLYPLYFIHQQNFIYLITCIYVLNLSPFVLPPQTPVEFKLHLKIICFLLPSLTEKVTPKIILDWERCCRNFVYTDKLLFMKAFLLDKLNRGFDSPINQAEGEFQEAKFNYVFLPVPSGRLPLLRCSFISCKDTFYHQILFNPSLPLSTCTVTFDLSS